MSDAIVVLAFPRIGDFIMCHPLIQLLRERFPHRPIDIVARRPGIAIASLMPEIREAITEYTAAGEISIRARLTLVRELRARRYQTAYVVSSAWKAGLAPLLAGIPERVGWLGEGRFVLINDIKLNKKRYKGTMRRAAAIGLAPGDQERKEWPVPRLAIPASMLAQWRERYGAKSGKVLAIAPGASYMNRAWPIERYGEIARRYAAKGWQIDVVGSPSEIGLANVIRDSVGSAVRIIMNEPVSDLACAIAEADVFLGNDSGPIHVAAALGKPCLGVFGPEDQRPTNPQVKIIRPQFEGAWEPKLWPQADDIAAALQDITDPISS